MSAASRRSTTTPTPRTTSLCWQTLPACTTETAAWLQPLAAHVGRYGVYRSRLTAALDAARAGDQRFVASPRVDSYHSVWFELHEDLIRLAGRTREA